MWAFAEQNWQFEHNVILTRKTFTETEGATVIANCLRARARTAQHSTPWGPEELPTVLCVRVPEVSENRQHC